jgi:hypothetical protein
MMLCVQEKELVADDDRSGPTRIQLAPTIALTKSEVIDACDGLARTHDVLVSLGQREDAAWTAELFECLEDRLGLV